MREISELKIKKVIHRPTQTFDKVGNRIYNTFEYDLSYKAEFEGNEKQRILAKIIDKIPLFLIFYFILQQEAFTIKEAQFLEIKKLLEKKVA